MTNKVVALGFNLVSKDKQLITAWINEAFKIKPEIIDLMTELYKPKDEKAVIVFGQTALKQLKDRPSCPFTVFKFEMDELDPEQGNDNSREYAWGLVMNLAKLVDEQDQKSYGSKLIESSPLPPVRKLTEKELADIKVAMELLDIREFELVPSHQNSSDSNRKSSS